MEAHHLLFLKAWGGTRGRSITCFYAQGEEMDKLLILVQGGKKKWHWKEKIFLVLQYLICLLILGEEAMGMLTGWGRLSDIVTSNFQVLLLGMNCHALRHKEQRIQLLWKRKNVELTHAILGFELHHHYLDFLL